MSGERWAISDDELTVLAMAADPDVELGDDAVPLRTGDPDGGLLPAWYMPAPRRIGGRGPRLAVAGIVGALLLVNGAGLCVTYGLPEIPW